MRSAGLICRKTAIVCHRWMGVTFCVLFAWWFLSGIFMMYCDFPSVGERDRLLHSPAIDPAKLQLTPREAWSRLGRDRAPGGVELFSSFDGRPVYRFTAGGGSGRGGRRGGRPGRQADGAATIYADDGTALHCCTPEMLLRIASAWTGQSSSTAHVESVTAPDQWTVQGALRNLRPLWKYSFPDGQQVYVSGSSGEVVQYTTRLSRLGAWLGPIPHWLYFTPLRIQQQLWTNVVIWSSGIATIAAILGLIAGILMYSPRSKYFYRGSPSRIPYTGKKRLHMTLGLFFGILAGTWAFSGMLSMDPPFLTPQRRPEQRGGGQNVALSAVARIQSALQADRFDLGAYDPKSPAEALRELGGAAVKRLSFTSFDGQAVYLASIEDGSTPAAQTRIVPVTGQPRDSFDPDRIFELITFAAGPAKVVEKHMLTSYDAWYLDRHRERPLPVMFARLSDDQHSQLYIDQRTGRIVAQHSDNSSFTTRWLYHGLHSLDFPWLYNYRPAWDIVVLTLMLGGLLLSITSVTIAYQLLVRKLRLPTMVARRLGPPVTQNDTPAHPIL